MDVLDTPPLSAVPPAPASAIAAVPPPSPGGPGAYGEKQAQDGVEFVILNDDVLTSVSNATMVLVDGSDLERMAVLYQFPQFLEHCPDESLSIMVPQICDGAVSWPPDVQMAAAEALYFVVNMRIPEVVARKIVVAALHIIAASESGDVFDACGEILSMMLPQVHRAEVLELVVPATVARATADAADSRRLAARIIGSLNDSLTAPELERLFLKHALALADDRDESVRAMIAQSLAAVGVKLPLKVVEKSLWPKLVVLMNDPNARVRAAAMRAIARAAEAHRAEYDDSPAYKDILLPMFLEECRKSSEVAASDLRTVDDDTYLMLEIFSEVYGYFLCAVSPLFPNESTWTTCLNTLRRMVTCNGPTVRHWCAFNVPAVALVCADKRTDKISGVVQALSVDSDVETRATLAAGFHETTRILGQGPLRAEIVSSVGDLLTDENPQVRMNTLEHFSEYMHILSTYDSTKLAGGKVPGAVSGAKSADDAKSEEASKDGKPAGTRSEDKEKFRQLNPIFASLDVMCNDSWRTQRLLATELKNSAHLVPQETLCEHVAPLLFQMARESTYLVRQAAMQALMNVLRYIPDVRRRNHILKHFRMEWARGKVYWTRLAYIDGTQCALSMFSNRLFSQLFKEEILSMVKDPVANVRHRLVRLFSSLAPVWKDMPEFRAALHTLAADCDAQVAADAKKFLDSLDLVPPLTPQQLEEDKKKEVQEEAFYVHKRKKRGQKNKASAAAAAAAAAAATAAPEESRVSIEVIRDPNSKDKPNGPGSLASPEDKLKKKLSTNSPHLISEPAPLKAKAEVAEVIAAKQHGSRHGGSRVSIEKKGRRTSSRYSRKNDPPPPATKVFCGCFGGSP